MNEGIYYLRLNGKVEGPYSIGQIYDLWAARKINSQTLFARFEEMEKWQPLSELTLKISAPKPTGSRMPATEPAPAAAQKQRPASNLRTEEYVPTVMLPTEQKPAPTKARRPSPFPAVQKLLFNFSYSIALCIITGLAISVYFMIFFSDSPDGKEATQSLLIAKQTGVISGLGLILMGGLLIVARQLNQLVVMFKGEPSDKIGPKPPAPPQDATR
jgi:hypothetical protein